ncbi:MAG: sulfite exporter TauE/SafE family protein, partial [Thermoanaerobaculia bacterium]|nr:sulfite exporter TauE/SafE family protein [Thermoanaerobaculia bacterium]
MFELGILLLVGLLAGTLNVVAGGGSFLTLPVLIFLGLPPTVANGTNQVGILAQNLGAVWSFHSFRVLRWRWALQMAVPATVGAALGTWAALEVSDEAFQKILAVLMVVVTLWTLVGRGRRGTEDPDFEPGPPGWPLWLGFFGVGLYGGFVQAGVGFFILAVTSWAGLDLVRGNAVKVLTILCFTILSLSLFAWQGQVSWSEGGILA